MRGLRELGDPPRRRAGRDERPARPATPRLLRRAGRAEARGDRRPRRRRDPSRGTARGPGARHLPPAVRRSHGAAQPARGGAGRTPRRDRHRAAARSRSRGGGGAREADRPARADVCARAVCRGRLRAAWAHIRRGGNRARRDGEAPVSEVRVDPLTGLRAIVAGDRANRPNAGLSADPSPPLDPAGDPFAEGHEGKTPPEVYAVRPGGGAADSPGWTVRVVPNLYPALSPDGAVPDPDASPDLFTAAPARGAHEVIVNAPQSATALAELPVEQVAGAMDVWRSRMRALDDEAVCIAPYGSRLPYQLMIAPRRARERFEDDGATGAALLHDVLGRLARRLGANPPLNLWVRTAPRGADHFCWRIDVMPRLTHLAGLELGTGLHLNIVPPEQAAAELREA